MLARRKGRVWMLARREGRACMMGRREGGMPVVHKKGVCILYVRNEACMLIGPGTW